MRCWEKFLHGKGSKALEKGAQGSGEIISLETFKTHLQIRLSGRIVTDMVWR